MKTKYILILTLISAVLLATSTIHSQRDVVMATINWEPYIGETLPQDGFFSEIVSESFAQVGYNVSLKYLPWARALKSVKEGSIDGIMVIYWEEERAQYLEYSDIILQVTEEFITLKDSPIRYNGNIETLKGYRIGMVRGTAEANDLKKDNLTVEVAADDQQNVVKLLNRRIDAIVVPPKKRCIYK